MSTKTFVFLIGTLGWTLWWGLSTLAMSGGLTAGG